MLQVRAGLLSRVTIFNRRLAGNLTPLLMPVGQSTTVCPAGTAFGVTNQAALPPGYNTVPVGSMLCMQKLGHQTIPAILPTGTALILQVIASQTKSGYVQCAFRLHIDLIRNSTNSCYKITLCGVSVVASMMAVHPE